MWGPDDWSVLYEQRVYAGLPVGLFALNIETAPGDEPGTVVLASPDSDVPPTGDYDVHLYLVDYRTREVLRRLTVRALRGYRFAVARGGEAAAVMRLDAPPSDSGPTPSALYIVPSLDQSPVRVAVFERGGFAGFRWANDRRHIVFRREVFDAEGYATGNYTVSVVDAHNPQLRSIPLDWIPRSLPAVPDLHVH